MKRILDTVSDDVQLYAEGRFDEYPSRHKKTFRRLERTI